MNDTDTYWDGQRLEELKRAFDAGRNGLAEPNGLIERWVNGADHRGNDDAIRLAVGSAVAAIAGAGIGPRWCGVISFAGQPCVKIDSGLRKLIYEYDYAVYDLIWLRRHQLSSLFCFEGLVKDAGAWTNEKDGRKREGLRKQVIRGCDRVDLLGCLRLLTKEQQRACESARKAHQGDLDMMMRSYSARLPKRAEMARERALQLLGLRLTGVAVEGADWADVASQNPDWEKAARLYRSVSGREVEPKLMADKLRSRFNDSQLHHELQPLAARPRGYWGDGLENDTKTGLLSAAESGVKVQLSEVDGSSCSHSPLGRVNTGFSLQPTVEPATTPHLDESIVVGIDPGLSSERPGGLAMICDGRLRTWPMPTGDDVSVLAEVVRLAVERRAKVFVEWNYPRGQKRWNVKSAFTFGRAVERAELAFLLAGVEVERIDPSAWKVEMDCRGDLEQRRSRLEQLLKERFGIEQDCSELPGGGTDAALIALAGAMKAEAAEAA